MFKTIDQTLLSMVPIQFSKWEGPTGIKKYIIEQTGCKPYSGAGINPRVDKKQHY